MLKKIAVVTAIAATSLLGVGAGTALAECGGCNRGGAGQSVGTLSQQGGEPAGVGMRRDGLCEIRCAVDY